MTAINPLLTALSTRPTTKFFLRMDLMMRKAGFSIYLGVGILALGSLSCRLPVSFLTQGPKEMPAESESWQAEVDALKSLTHSQPIPNFLTDPEIPQTGEVFDPNQLLVPLGHLSLQPGYTLDFVYRYDGIGGRPFIYAREVADPPLENYDEFLEATQDEVQYLDFVVCDGTEEAYFQYILLSMMGDQFYLYWHAGYDDSEIIASRSHLETLVEEMSTTEFGINFSASQKRQALKIQPAPIVEFDEGKVNVRVVWFTKWGGFYESIYTLSQSAPHHILNLETTNLLEYDCGILF